MLPRPAYALTPCTRSSTAGWPGQSTRHAQGAHVVPFDTTGLTRGKGRRIVFENNVDKQTGEETTLACHLFLAQRQAVTKWCFK